MKDYIKCVFANKFTLLGFILVFIGATLSYFLKEFYLTVYFYYGGAFLLGATWFGVETFYAYVESKKRISKYGLENEKEKFFPIYEMYCSRQGIKLAIKEEKLKKEK